MQVGDKLYCKISFTNPDYPLFKCKKGDIVTINRYEKDEDGITLKTVNSSGIDSWFYIIKKNSARKSIPYLWNYFRNINKIRRIANEF